MKDRIYIMVLLVYLLSISAFGQDKELADSLVALYKSGEYLEGQRLEILNEIAQEHPDPYESLRYSDELIKIADSVNSTHYLVNGYLAKGISHRLLGNYPDALINFFAASELASNNAMIEDIGIANVNIGDVFSELKNHSEAIKYYKAGIEILKKEGNSIILALTQYNIGDEYYENGNLDSALIYFQESGRIFQEQDFELGVAYTMGSIGQVHSKFGHDTTAENSLVQSINTLSELGDFYPVSVFLIDLARIYFKRGDLNTALMNAERSLRLAEEMGLKEQISDANLVLSEIYKGMGDWEKSMFHFETHTTIKDSLNKFLEVANLNTQFELDQKQAEVDLLTKEAEIADLQGRRQRWVIFGTGLSLILVAVLAFASYRRYKYVKETNLIIEEEKTRSDDLLLNILPEETASELKQHGQVKARKIDKATVLFTDFIEFTRYAEKVAPEQMVQSIDYYFKAFDDIITKYNLEKIKTIGDSYMCAGGLHSDSSQAEEVVNAALEMIDIVDKVKSSDNGIVHFDMRIGVHTGPVVAGIVGTKKWQYDIWGDTVNIASGMESKSSSGRVNISETTLAEIEGEFNVNYRGEIGIKNRGDVKMYFVKAKDKTAVSN